MTASRSAMARYAMFSGMLAFAGLPVYVHAPKFFADAYGASLAGIGAVLLALRVLDFAQDPVLGWLADRLGAWRSRVVAIAAAVLALGVFGLFAIAPPVAPLLWMGAMLAVVFTAYSLLMILLYSQGVAMAGAGGAHVSVAAWREAGALIGVCAACAAPALFEAALPGAPPFAVYAVAFAAFAFAATVAMGRRWTAAPREKDETLRDLLRDPVLKRLLIIGVFNAAPVAVTASLFLFFVEHRLEAPVHAGPMLIAFFLAAAVGAPIWSAIARRMGARAALAAGMALSISAFWGAWSVGPSDVGAFYLICIASGFALGADMTLLPALFSRRLATAGAAPGQAFGVWNFCAKVTLAIAAATVLPILEVSGFTVSGGNPPEALTTLSALYALAPCALKAVALALLLFTELEAEHEAKAYKSDVHRVRGGRHAFADK